MDTSSTVIATDEAIQTLHTPSCHFQITREIRSAAQKSAEDFALLYEGYSNPHKKHGLVILRYLDHECIRKAFRAISTFSSIKQGIFRPSEEENKERSWVIEERLRRLVREHSNDSKTLETQARSNGIATTSDGVIAITDDFVPYEFFEVAYSLSRTSIDVHAISRAQACLLIAFKEAFSSPRPLYGDVYFAKVSSGFDVVAVNARFLGISEMILERLEPEPVGGLQAPQGHARASKASATAGGPDDGDKDRKVPTHARRSGTPLSQVHVEIKPSKGNQLEITYNGREITDNKEKRKLVTYALLGKNTFSSATVCKIFGGSDGGDPNKRRWDVFQGFSDLGFNNCGRAGWCIQNLDCVTSLQPERLLDFVYQRWPEEYRKKTPFQQFVAEFNSLRRSE